MNGLIYTRTHPTNLRVNKSDQKRSQENRCREFLRRHNIKFIQAYHDDGNFLPNRLLPNFKVMINRLHYRNDAHIIVCDHPARLGTDTNIRNANLMLIHKTGSSFLFADQDRKMESIVAQIMEAAK